MIGGLLRLIVVVVIVVGLGAFFLGYRWSGDSPNLLPDQPIGTTGPLRDVDTSKARATGAEIGEKVAEGANQATRVIAAGTLTAKIKSKMALDDSIDAVNIDIDTDGSVVTLTGRVDNTAQKGRALQLARATEGVTSVVDRLTVDAR